MAKTKEIVSLIIVCSFVNYDLTLLQITFTVSAAEMKSCVEVWPENEGPLVLVKKDKIDKDGTQKISYKTIFVQKIAGLRKRERPFKSEALRSFSQHFSVRWTCLDCNAAFVFKASRTACVKDVDVIWQLAATTCKCFGDCDEPEYVETAPDVEFFSGEDDENNPSAEAAVVNNLLLSHQSTPTTANRASKQFLTPTSSSRQVTPIASSGHGSPATSSFRTPSRNQRWSKASIAMALTPTANSRVRKELDVLEQCIGKARVREGKILEGIQLAKNYILNVETLTAKNPSQSPSEVLDRHKIDLTRQFAAKVYRNNALVKKDTQEILSELALDNNSVKSSRKTVKRSLNGELEKSSEEKCNRKRHKKSRSSSNDRSHTGSESGDENFDIDFIA